MKQTLVFIYIFLFAVSFSTADENNNLPKSNVKIIKSIIMNVTADIKDKLKKRNIDSIPVEISQSELKYIIEQELFSEKSTIQFTIWDASVESYPYISIKIDQPSVRYDIYPPSEDSLTRIIEINLYARLRKNKRLIENFEFNPMLAQDTIARDDVILLEEGSLGKFKGKVPEKEESFFHKVAEPVILVTTAIVTVALLYFVRSE